MAIAFSNLGISANPDINSTTDANSYANSSWTPPTAGLIIVFVTSKLNAGPEAPTISGNDLTWTQIATVRDPTDDFRITLFGANASGSAAGVTTVDFGGVTQGGCNASFFLATGVDLSVSVAAAFVQAPTSNGTGTSASVTLAAAGSADNRPIAGTVVEVNAALAERANWTEADGFNNTTANMGSMNTQWRDDAFETTASATWDGSSVPWGMIAAELKVEVAGGRTTKNIHPWHFGISHGMGHGMPGGQV